MRIKNSVNNIMAKMASYFITLIITFISRTIFIKLLGHLYLGINGLFTNVIAILSLAELGIGTAIIFDLYKPLLDDDREKTKSLMLFYKRAYKIVSVVVLVLGISLIPFLEIIIKDKPDIPENISLIYMLFVISASFSYLLTYKRSLIIANQKEATITKYTTVINLIMNIIQIGVLIYYKNYIVYLVIHLSFILLQNIFISYKCDKLYPFIKEKAKVLEPSEQKRLFRNIKAVMIYRFCERIMDSVESIVISSFIGISWVGLYSNYYLIINGVRSPIFQLMNSVTASIGNLNASEDNKKKLEIFYAYINVNFWVNGIAAICFYLLIEPFILLWIGPTYLLPHSTLISLVVGNFIVGMLVPISIYRNTMGLFIQGRIRPLIMGIMNIILAISFSLYWGITGVFVASIISRLTTQAWYDPYILFKHGFRVPVKGYYKKLVQYKLILLTALIPTKMLCLLIADNTIFSFIMQVIICIITPSSVFWLLMRRMPEYMIIENIVLSQIQYLLRNSKGINSYVQK